MINSFYPAFDQFFNELNSSICYVILRNWEALDDGKLYIEGHDDIDILVADIDAFMKMFDINCVYRFPNRNNYIVRYKDITIRVDVRYIGDGYYDSEWERTILKHRIWSGFYYYVDHENYAYSLGYHALIHKKHLSKEYKYKIANLMKFDYIDEIKLLYEVRMFMDCNKYKATLPKDPGVYFNRYYSSFLEVTWEPLIFLERKLFMLACRFGFNW